ncbi:MAG: hypothetical protein IPN53_16170, partial [Comamonadaceae bacterium]|nr:hypothetical protein [Comamonadaceae bacterium]
MPNGKVLVAGGYGNSTLASAELFDPATDQMSVAGSLAAARVYHSATLLPNGKVLFAGGTNSSALASAELHDAGQAVSDSRRPVVSSVGGLTAGSGGVLSLTGSKLTGDSEGSNNNSAANLPVIQLRRLDNDAQIPVLTSAVSATAYTSRAMGVLPAGHYRLTVISNGVPSIATLVSVTAPTLTITPASLPAAT